MLISNTATIRPCQPADAFACMEIFASNVPGFFGRFGFTAVHTEPNGFAPGLDEVKMNLPRAAWGAQTLTTRP
jgi:hypothetical protein